MIAQFVFSVPFTLLSPASVTLDWIHEEVDGETVAVRFAPANAPDVHALHAAPAEVQLDPSNSIDGEPVIQLSLMVAEITRADFDRAKGRVETDPLVDLPLAAVNRVLTTTRALSRASHIRQLERHRVSWAVTYLADDHSQLPDDPDKVQRRGNVSARVGGIVFVTPGVWAEIRGLRGRRPPRWGELLLDAYEAMPDDIGSALVLAYAAVETCAGAAAASLASASVPGDFWQWVVDDGRVRVDHLLNALRKALGADRLIDADKPLWDDFLQLQKARNSFSHAGEAHDDSGPVTTARAGQLIGIAERVVAWLEQSLAPGERRFQSAVVVTSNLTVPIMRIQ